MTIVISASIVTIWLLTGLSQVSLPYQNLSYQVASQPSFSVVSKADNFPLQNVLEVIQPLLLPEETICSEVPSGVGIPGFKPGISKSDVIRMLGVPSGNNSGYWPNTSAVSYELVPNRVSLGFVFDKNSERIRQSEAAFTGESTFPVMELTLNGMLGCKLNQPILQGLERVRLRKSRRYSFSLDLLKGVIERDNRDRIYIGIWDRDLH